MADLIPMDKLGKLLAIVSTSRHEEDFVDRLNYRVMTAILLTCAISIFAKDYVGNPIKCWGSAEWPGAWTEYAHDICFVENTYYVPMDQGALPNDHDEREKAQIGYYQWVPFILVFQALCFLAPSFIWQYWNWSFSGIQLQAILSMVTQARTSAAGLSPDARQTIAYHLGKSLKTKCVPKHNILGTFRRAFYQRSLCVTYCTVKLLYIANILFQLYFVGMFLGGNAIIFGYSTLDALMNGKMWEESGIFPRVTMCDFKVRAVMGGGHIEHNSVQCVLVGNMINEKVFIMLFLVLLFLLVVTIASLFLWLRKLFFAAQRRALVRELLSPSVVDCVYPLDKDAEQLAIIFGICGHDTPAIYQLEVELDSVKVDDSDSDSDEEEESQSSPTCLGSTATGSTAKMASTLGTLGGKKEKTHNKSLHMLFKQMKAVEKAASPKAKRAEERVKAAQRLVATLINRERLENQIRGQHYSHLCELLGADGALVLELVRQNSSESFAALILAQLSADDLEQRLKNIKKASERGDKSMNAGMAMAEGGGDSAAYGQIPAHALLAGYGSVNPAAGGGTLPHKHHLAFVY